MRYSHRRKPLRDPRARVDLRKKVITALVHGSPFRCAALLLLSSPFHFFLRFSAVHLSSCSALFLLSFLARASLDFSKALCHRWAFQTFRSAPLSMVQPCLLSFSFSSLFLLSPLEFIALSRLYVNRLLIRFHHPIRQRNVICTTTDPITIIKTNLKLRITQFQVCFVTVLMGQIKCIFGRL